MQLYVYPLLAIFLTVLFLRIMFDIIVLHRRLRIAVNSKLVGVTFLANLVVLVLLAGVAEPLMTSRWLLFILQLLLVMGIEAPMYQIFFRTQSWYKIVISLLIARFVFALLSMGFALLILLSAEIS